MTFENKFDFFNAGSLQVQNFSIFIKIMQGILRVFKKLMINYANLLKIILTVTK